MKMNDIRGNYWICSNSEYVVLSGKDLWIVAKDGRGLHHKKNLSNTYKTIFLSDNRLLIGGGKNSSYCMISLEDGSELWRVPLRKAETSSRRFAICEEKGYAFDYFTWGDKLYFVKIALQSGELETQVLSEGFRTTVDITASSDGCVYMLQTHHDETPNGIVSQNGVRTVWDGKSFPKDVIWNKMWSDLDGSGSFFFLNGIETILSKDLYIIEPSSAKKSFLLQNATEWEQPGLGPSACWFEGNGQYLTLMYNNCNVIIDLSKREVVARYGGAFTKGCLINGEYWISSDTGIQRKPFPLIEELPPRKLVSW